MQSAADARNEDEDDAPPESGIRRRAPATATLARSPQDTEARSAHALAEITVDACLETWQLTRRLLPLQGAWFLPSASRLGAALLTLLSAPREGAPRSAVAHLRRCWPELVPGYAAMDTLAHLLVDTVCAG